MAFFCVAGTLGGTRTHNQHASDALLCPLSYERTPHRIWRIVKALGVRAGLPWLHPHNFRHTYATSWLLKGGSAFHLQTIGGWASMALIRKTYAKAAVEQAALDEAERLFGDEKAAP